MQTPLSQKATRTVQDAWVKMQKGKVYTVMCDHGDHDPALFVESPDEQLEEEAVLRVFLTEEEAVRYIETQHTYGIEDLPLRILSGSLEEVMAVVEEHTGIIQMTFNAPLRVDICAMPEGEHARYLDTLSSPLIDIH